MTDATMINKHPVEDEESWKLYLERATTAVAKSPPTRRYLKHHDHHDKATHSDESEIEMLKEEEFWQHQKVLELDAKEKKQKQLRKHKQRMQELYADPGIQHSTVHGMMIDAGSSGSRMHLYEWDPRVLRNAEDVQAAVAGKKLSFPASESRWTDRLRPGLSSFADLPDDQLQTAVADYLDPLLEFARSILHEKQDEFSTFPIFLRATAGMRTLDAPNRARVITTVRELFSNKTYCPFYFTDEQARVLSGEEEAIYDWAGVNFVTGTLLKDSEGAGTVISPRLTYGALDLGGASTQISFYEPNEDIMAGLFKLQIGQGKHWNVYTHSFLYYGINEATNRFDALLAGQQSATERLIEGVYNPCLPGGSSTGIRTDIHMDETGMERWDEQASFYQATLKNDYKSNDFDQCSSLVKELLHLDQNNWCDFAHKGDCSFAGVHQPRLPTQSERFGEFLAFSNFYHVWRFLNLPERASVAQLEKATMAACAMSKEETFDFSNGRVDDEEVEQYCFRSVYVLHLLRSGFGFQDDDYITSVSVLNGQKVGWALGAMLYEINTLPWQYNDEGVQSSHLDSASKIDGGKESSFTVNGRKGLNTMQWEFILIGLLALFAGMLYRRRRRYEVYEYEPVKDADIRI